ncbi:uncharacterized protein LOC132755114 [Ruditapes philippinarum]|uniref:uncharacterized protein LOC132755114 n=1 Tax=Ruditapes philippinarum TaxID=129788 RepID=UPI00295ACEB2|nr:uncharacterized protein LOC132755114 [Ruditapes philippinarum]
MKHIEDRESLCKHSKAQGQTSLETVRKDRTMEKKHREIFLSNLPDFVEQVDPQQLLTYLPCLSKSSRERVDTAQKSVSRSYAAQVLHSHLERRPEGFRQLVLALRHENVGCTELADRLDPQHCYDPSYEERESLCKHSKAQGQTSLETVRRDGRSVTCSRHGKVTSSVLKESSQKPAKPNTTNIDAVSLDTNRRKLRYGRSNSDTTEAAKHLVSIPSFVKSRSEAALAKYFDDKCTLNTLHEERSISSRPNDRERDIPLTEA